MADSRNTSLTRHVVTSSAWLAAGRWGIRLLGLLSTLVLARLLTPDDYGIVALASLVVMLLDSLTDFRFDRALIRYQDATEDEFNTAWTLNVIRGLLVAPMLAAGSWLFAAVFHEPRLVAVIQVLAFTALVDGFQNIGMVEYQRQLRFDRDFAFRIVPKVAAVLVTIGLALVWRSYWALIAGMVGASVTRLVVSFVMHPFRPRFMLLAWRRLFSFSGWLMASQSVALLNQRMEQFLIGRFLPTSTVGVYNLAYDIGSMATTEVVGPAAHALFPGFSKIADDRERLRQAYEKSVQVVVAIGTPLGIGLALVAGEFVLIVLGKKWVDVVEPLRVLSVAFSLAVIADASTGVLTSLGRTRDLFRLHLQQFVLRLPVTAAVVWAFGLTGAIWTRFAFGLMWVGQFIWAVHKALDFSFKRVMAATWRTYAASGVMAASVLLTGVLLDTTNYRDLFAMPIGDVWTSLMIKALIGAAVYALAHLAFWQLQGRPDGIESIVFSQVAGRIRRSRP